MYSLFPLFQAVAISACWFLALLPYKHRCATSCTKNWRRTVQNDHIFWNHSSLPRNLCGTDCLRVIMWKEEGSRNLILGGPGRVLIALMITGITAAVTWKALLSRCQPRAQCFAKLLLSATLWGVGAGELSNLLKISHETWPQKWESLYYLSSVQFSSVAQTCPTLCDPIIYCSV